MKRRNFIKGVGLVGAATYLDPFSLIKPVPPYKEGDIFLIYTKVDYDNWETQQGFIYSYSHRRKWKYDTNDALAYIDDFDTGDDDHNAGYYELRDRAKLRKDIISYFKKLETRLNNPKEDFEANIEFEELCIACILLGDKELWQSMANKYPRWTGYYDSYEWEEIKAKNMERIDFWELLTISPGHVWTKNWKQREKLGPAAYQLHYIGFEKFPNAKVVKATYTKYEAIGKETFIEWDDYVPVYKTFPYDIVTKDNWEEYKKCRIDDRW